MQTQCASVAARVDAAKCEAPSVGDLLPVAVGFVSECVVLLQLGCDEFRTVVDDGKLEFIHWEAISGQGEALIRSAQLPQVMFVN